MAEKTPNQQLAEKLLFRPAYVGDKSAAVKQEAHAFAEGYKKFLDAGKTEREVAAESEQMLKDAGYQQFDPKKTYAPGDKVYFSQLGKAIVASTIGTRSFEDGFHLVIAHTDSPRLDLRPTPLYESDHLSYFKTHYYGGIRKYQWGTMPLSIHGVFTRDDGTTVTVCVGEDEGDPVFCITDLLPHLPTTAAGARWMRCCKRKNTPPTASRCRAFPTTRCTTMWKRSPPAMQCIRTCMALDPLEPGLPV